MLSTNQLKKKSTTMNSSKIMDEYPEASTFSKSHSEYGEKTPLLGKLSNLDEALDSTGVGFFHLLLILVAGWALASDSVEVQCISFVTPQLGDDPDHDLRPSDSQKGLLDAIIFLGMMVGGYFWGSWSDVVGRRSCLITSLLFNGLFGFASSLSPKFSVFLFFRFMSGVGVGGSLPVAFSYFCEFFSKRTKGPFVIVLAGFWILGSVFASLLALAVIEPLKQHMHTRIGSIHLSSWRVYIMLSTFPAISAAFFLIFLPESPSFLFTKNKLQKTLNALAYIARLNRCGPFCFAPSGKVVNIQDLEKIAPTMEEQTSFLFKIETVIKSTLKLFSFAYIRPSVLLCFIWFTFSFGYYGLLLWFPEYFARMQGDNGTSDANVTIQVYVDSVYTSLAAIPATFLGIITVNLLGGKIMLVLSILLCAVSAFLIKVVPPRESNIVILSSFFNGIATFGWNALDIITTSDLFPVQLRSTAFGIQAVFGRLGAILGNLAFGQLIDLNPMYPIVMVAVLLALGGLSAILLPTLPGEGAIHRVRNIKRKSLYCMHCLSRPFQKPTRVQ